MSRLNQPFLSTCSGSGTPFIFLRPDKTFLQVGVHRSHRSEETETQRIGARGLTGAQNSVTYKPSAPQLHPILSVVNNTLTCLLRFYAPPGGPTSAPSARLAAEWPPAASSRTAGGHRHSIPLDLEDLEELNKALSRAVQAAERVRSTAKHMSRSLSADLRQAHSLRGSCLF